MKLLLEAFRTVKTLLHWPQIASKVILRQTGRNKEFSRTSTTISIDSPSV